MSTIILNFGTKYTQKESKLSPQVIGLFFHLCSFL